MGCVHPILCEYHNSLNKKNKRKLIGSGFYYYFLAARRPKLACSFLDHLRSNPFPLAHSEPTVGPSLDGTHPGLSVCFHFLFHFHDVDALSVQQFVNSSLNRLEARPQHSARLLEFLLNRAIK